MILVGLKSDLRTKSTCIDLLKTQGLTPVTSEQGAAVAKRMGATYAECSSKEMVGVTEIFEHAVDMAVGGREGSWRNGASSRVSNGSRGMKRKRTNCKFL